jgi:peptidyl-prolyl cis-trans isomerase D
MTQTAKFFLRLVICGLVIAWLAGDLFLFHGPLRRQIDRANPRSAQAIAAAKGRSVVARVFNLRITRSQLDRAVHERLWLEGKTPGSLAPEDLKAVRYAALDELIDHELLRVRTAAGTPQPSVTDEELNERLRRLLGRFESKSAMETAMKSQGIASERDLRERLAARIRQEKYVRSETDAPAQVTDAEARAWFDENQRYLATPERIEARHVFIATLDRRPEEAKGALDAALADLTSGAKDFATLARELSEDPATRDKSGELGWMTRERLPADFATAVFALPLRQPSLVRTRLGWHLVEVTARKQSAPRTFEEAKPEVLAALEAVKRQQAVTRYRATLRRSGAAGIGVFHDMMED